MLRKLRLLSAAGLAILAASCGGSDKFETTGGDVEGTVTLDGKPVEIGMVFFYPAGAAGSESVAAQLRAGGKFTTNNVPIGGVKIAVKTSHMKGMAMAGKIGGAPKPDAKGGAPIGPAGTFLDVPKRYENADTSKLAADIVKGTNTVTLELKK